MIAHRPPAIFAPYYMLPCVLRDAMPEPPDDPDEAPDPAMDVED